MFDITKTPERISKRIKGLELSYDSIGKSSSTVLLFEEMVLKVEKITRSSEHEIKLLGWLDGKLPVPKIIEAEKKDGYSFLLMTKLPGEMVCAGNSQKNMEDTIIALVNGLKMMWQVDITNCPCRNTVSEKLIQAKYNIENNLVDIDDFEPETLSTEGFSDIYDLYNYLDINRPKEDLVFSHGDFTFPNIYVLGSNVTGLIDWGNGGVADRWQDISLCYRSLKKINSKYVKFFFRELGVEPDEEKTRYLNLLDEFF